MPLTVELGINWGRVEGWPCPSKHGPTSDVPLFRLRGRVWSVSRKPGFPSLQYRSPDRATSFGNYGLPK